MKSILSSTLFITILSTSASVNARGWKLGSSTPSSDSGKCAAPKDNKISPLNSTEYGQEMCSQAIQYQNLDFSNVTAMFQPAFWECQYPGIKKFCSERGNGTFCYRPECQMNDTCLDMAVVRCPEGILSSCRSNYICNELISSNYTCNSTSMSLTDQNYTESGFASCQAIEDVVKLPPAMNVTTTIDAQNNTVTIGQQVFGFPFAITTTVNCTYTTLSMLPTGFPQPSQALSVCFNSDLPYDQMIPKTTCAGPYPPGPMTTVTESMSNSTSASSSESCLPTSSSTACPCPIDSTSSSSTSSYYTTTPETSSSDSSVCPTPSSSSSSIVGSASSTYSASSSSSSYGGPTSGVMFDYEPEDSYSYESTPSPIYGSSSPVYESSSTPVYYPSTSSDQYSSTPSPAYEPTPRRYY